MPFNGAITQLSYCLHIMISNVVKVLKSLQKQQHCHLIPMLKQMFTESERDQENILVLQMCVHLFSSSATIELWRRLLLCLITATETPPYQMRAPWRPQRKSVHTETSALMLAWVNLFLSDKALISSGNSVSVRTKSVTEMISFTTSCEVFLPKKNT